MSPSAAIRRRFFPIALLALVTTLVLVWRLTPPAASAPPETSAPEQAEKLPNYDLRLDRSDAARAARERLAAAAGATAIERSQARKKLAAAKDELRAGRLQAKIEDNEELGIPEVIAPDPARGGRYLSGPHEKGERAAALRAFLREHSALFGVGAPAVEKLETVADYTNPDGALSFVELAQKIDRVPVFRGEIRAAFTARGEMFRLVNNLAPGLDEAVPAKDFGRPERAVAAAAGHVDAALDETSLARLEASADEQMVTFARGPFAAPIPAAKIYFPLDDGVARPAWRVIFETADEAFAVIVDAADGTLLWRKNLTERQTQSATYNVYGNAASMMRTGDSPTPSTPGCSSGPLCPQPPIVARQSFTLIGNEPPYAFNNTGWIPDGETRTIGNNAEAGIDRDQTQGIDPNGWAFGGAARSFVFNYNPAPGMPPPGEEPVPPAPQPYPPTAFQQGSITNAFYTANRWHDETYRLGFTEQARNFQVDNFGRGGAGNDSISVEVQDGSGTNNANFSTTPDGQRPRAQFFVWTGPTPDRDGALDNQVVVHELTHGLSNRLHGNATGLSTNMARGMGEGWSDFFALALLSEPSDDVFGVYTVGCYSTFEISPGFTANCYYGIRRFPTARLSALGPNGKPHSPLTFRHLNANCNTEIGTTTTIGTISAYPRGPVGVTQCDQVHNLGEFWAAVLWEVRGFLIDAHGAAEGNRRALQYVTDGMKLSPFGPTMLQSRDAIIAAAQAVDLNDVRHIWRGFAVRGMGFSARIVTASPASVVEAFDTPNVVIGAAFAASDAPGNNNGYFEPGERIALTIPLVNESGAAITGVTLQIAGGASAFYGDIANGQTAVRVINYTIPSNAPCGDFTLTFNITGSAGPRTETRSIRLGVPVGGPPVTFANSTAVTIDDNTTATPYGTTINVSGLTGTKIIKLELTGVTHTFPADIDFLLVGPAGRKFTAVSDSGGGGDVSNLNLVLTDAAAALPSTTQWVAGEFRPHNVDTTTDVFPAPAPTAPYENPAPAGTATFASVFGTNGANLNGTWTLYVRDDAGTDAGAMAGWKLTFEANDYICVVAPPAKSRADFDGDGKSDVSVFRPSEGNWYLNRSTAGFAAYNWGLAGDRLTPGDFDGDGKADAAVFRPSADAAQPDFYVLHSANFTYSGYSWGLPGDVPVVEDYDGDRKSDIAVFRPGARTFYVLRSGGGPALTLAGNHTGLPTPGDFDGDGKADLATYNVTGWLISYSNVNYATSEFVRWGASGDVPVTADYDGDAKDDLAVFRPSDSVWYVRKSTGGYIIVQFGLATDVPVPADYDGDGKADIAVFRDGIWYLNRSTAGLSIQQFGLAGDVPVAKGYLP